MSTANELLRRAYEALDRFAIYDVPLGCTPLYIRPWPARKPMTEEEIAKGFLPEPTTGMKRFRAGIRFAEKHHNIK